MTDRELMQRALDALVLNNKEWEELADQSGRWKAEEQDHYHHTELTINALRDRLAQPEWVGLTDEEIQEMRLKTLDSVTTNYETYKAIEAKLKEKNT
jgi:hypothetical protein